MPKVPKTPNMPKGKPPAVSLVSLGCPKNLIDSERILAVLASGGCVVGASMDRADVIVINTCGFIDEARRESLDVIAEALAHKRAGRARRVVVAGCLSNRDGRELYAAAPGIDAVVGVNNREEILQAVTAPGRVTRIDPCGGEIASDAGRFRLTPRHTAYLRISEGCSQKCTFCTIPAIRGPLRSKPPQQVLAEARELIADGAVELNVIGQETTSYGLDLRRKATAAGERANLPSLLRRLDELDGLRRIRLMYAYPRRFTNALIDAIAECRRVVPYVDLPLQHISDSILRRMGRGVTRKGMENLLARIRRRIDGVTIRTTMIVGFPGEQERDFRELLEFVKHFCFDAMGVFAFSPEEPTPAARMDGQVPEEVKRERVEALMLAQQKIAFEANRDRIGREVEVLVDGLDPSGRCVGRHRGQAPDIDGACLLSAPRPPGSMIKSQVTDFQGYDLIVEPV